MNSLLCFTTLIFVASTVFAAEVKTERVLCKARIEKQKVSGKQKVLESQTVYAILSDGLRTTWSDGNKEVRSTENTYFDLQDQSKTKKAKELVVIDKKIEGEFEIQHVEGTYISIKENSTEPISVTKIKSEDTYQIAGANKTLVKSMVDGKEIHLSSTDTESTFNENVKIYTSRSNEVIESVLADGSIQKTVKFDMLCTIEVVK